LKLDCRELSLHLRSTRSGSCTERYSIPLDEIEWNLPDLEPAGSTGILELTVTCHESTWICSGFFSAEFVTQCARCLEKALFTVDAEVYRIYTWDEQLADDLDTEFITSTDGTVSILDAVREAVILSVPGKPLCREDCNGLCPTCGVNLNVTSCEHSGS